MNSPIPPGTRSANLLNVSKATLSFLVSESVVPGAGAHPRPGWAAGGPGLGSRPVGSSLLAQSVRVRARAGRRALPLGRKATGEPQPGARTRSLLQPGPCPAFVALGKGRRKRYENHPEPASPASLGWFNRLRAGA